MTNNSSHTPSSTPGDAFDSFSHHSQYLVLALTILGNSLLILTLSVRERAMNFLDKLMLNSVFCNVLLVLFSIPTNLYLEHAPVYPFGAFGNVVCKLIDPLSTHFINTCVVTYIGIAVERLMVVSRMKYKPPSCRQTFIVIFSIHLFSLVSVSPYMRTLQVQTDEYGSYCGETWGMSARKSYTLVLFLIQYGVPVPVMFACYARIWFIVYQNNQNVISSMMEMLPSKTSAQIKEEKAVLNSRHEAEQMDADKMLKTCLGASKKDCRRLSVKLTKFGRKPRMKAFYSKRDSAVNGGLSAKHCAQIVAFKRRYEQTRRLLIRFTVLMLVFTICMLPNQVFWLLIDFKFGGNEYFDTITLFVAHLVTYVNCVLNPLLYGQYDKTFCSNVHRIYRNVRKSVWGDQWR